MNDLHEAHDEQLVAAFAAGDLDGSDRQAAAALTSSCPDCAALERDLRLIAAAIHDLPPVRRERDFTLTPDVARRLHRPVWRRALAALAGPRLQLAGPVGAGLAAIGLAGLLLSTIPAGLPLGGAATAPAAVPASPAGAPANVDTMSREESDPGGVQGTPEDRAGAGAGAAGSPAPVVPFEAQQPAADGDDRAAVGADGPDGFQAPAARAVDTTVAVLSGTLLIVGLGLFGLRWTANRLGDG